jgi:hypothetical protein
VCVLFLLGVQSWNSAVPVVQTAGECWSIYVLGP